MSYLGRVKNKTLDENQEMIVLKITKLNIAVAMSRARKAEVLLPTGLINKLKGNPIKTKHALTMIDGYTFKAEGRIILNYGKTEIEVKLSCKKINFKRYIYED